MLKTRLFNLATVLLVLMGTSIISSGQKVLSEKLPKIEDFTITFLEKPTKEGNAILSLKFDEKVKLPENFSIQLDKDRLVEFADSGEKNDFAANDGVFTALTFFREEEVLTPEMRKGGTFPIFNGRELVGYKEFPPVKEIIPNRAVSVNTVGNPANIDPERSLLVRDPRVVQDKTRTRTNCATGSMGTWSFGYLMTQMANETATGINPSDFTMEWLLRWYKDEVVNTFTIGQRAVGIRQLISKWKKLPDGRLDLAFAPFRLLAIVNRADLRGSSIYGQEQSDNAGELRFVFGVVDPENCSTQRFTTIFEYGVKKESCQAIQDWAIRWKKLDQLVLGSVEYNKALEILTQEIVKANADPTRPNGSSLNQMRTNEISLDSPWELREFQLDQRSSVSQLKSVTIKQTPDSSHNGTYLLTDFINQFENELLAGNHAVTEDYQGIPFLGAAIEYDASDFWSSRGINNNEARHKFSLATCNSCHGREVDTGFLQIGTAPFGNSTAALSTFLRGGTPSTTDIEFSSVIDPVDSTTSRKFNDLLRRAADLDALVSTPCGRMFAVTSAIDMTH
jgi:hypothetical protein